MHRGAPATYHALRANILRSTKSICTSRTRVPANGNTRPAPRSSTVRLYLRAFYTDYCTLSVTVMRRSFTHYGDIRGTIVYGYSSVKPYRRSTQGQTARRAPPRAPEPDRNATNKSKGKAQNQKGGRRWAVALLLFGFCGFAVAPIRPGCGLRLRYESIGYCAAGPHSCTMVCPPSPVRPESRDRTPRNTAMGHGTRKNYEYRPVRRAWRLDSPLWSVVIN